MNLHHAGRQPDWQDIPPGTANGWQRMARGTHGLVTPGNAISVAGAVLSLAGIALLQHSLAAGAVLLVVGRLFDAVDGTVAERTGTKSPVGKYVDATLDKIVILAGMLALASAGIMPFWVAVAILAFNALNVIATGVAARNSINLQPSAAGKLAMAGYWVTAVGFIAGAITTNAASDWQGAAAHLVVAITGATLLVGAYATAQYLLLAFGITENREPIDTVFARYVIIRNPESTEAGRAGARIRELRTVQPHTGVTVIETSPGGPAANRHLLELSRDLLGPNTLLCIAAGDGTVNMVVGLLLREPGLSTEVRRTPILPLWGGNANDLAHMLNGHASRSSMKHLLRDGHVVAIRPIACALRLPDGSERQYAAACYASFGASAFATEELERTTRKSPMRRFGGTRFGQEIIAVSRALIESPTFTIRQGGRTREIFERTYLNGSRFAKVIGAPLKLTDEAFHMAMIEHKHFIAVLLHVLGLAEGREGARITMVNDSFTLLDDTWAQFDGEAVRIPKGTRVTVKLGSRPFHALATRLR